MARDQFSKPIDKCYETVSFISVTPERFIAKAVIFTNVFELLCQQLVVTEQNSHVQNF